VVPSLALFHFKDPQLAIRPLNAPGLRREIFVIRRSDRSLSIAAQALLEFLIARKPKAAQAL
jgi:LysR family transcriptional regulator, carnitine catabolism transcriptional activator